MITTDTAVPSHLSNLVDTTARHVTQPVVPAKASGLVDTRRSTGSFTALSTVDAAFVKPQIDTVQSLSRLEGKVTLRDILRYHMDVLDAVMLSK